MQSQYDPTTVCAGHREIRHHQTRFASGAPPTRAPERSAPGIGHWGQCASILENEVQREKRCQDGCQVSKDRLEETYVPHGETRPSRS